jgi:ubiquinone/menaquinone biosynthesis C-methylase UbiE
MAEHICPVWVGYLLANPLRKLGQNPQKLLSPYLKPGMITLDVGCAMGFFTLPMAEMVRPGGRVIAVDVQEKMIEKLRKKMSKRNLNGIVETRVCTENSFNIDDLKQEVDFALLFAVLHETPEPVKTLREIGVVLKKGGRLLLGEPRGHVNETDFKGALKLAEQADLYVESSLKVHYSHAAVLVKM